MVVDWWDRRRVASSSKGGVRRLLASPRERPADVPGAFPADAQRTVLLQARVPFHLAFRAACRLRIAIEAEGRTSRRQAAVVAALAWDVVEAVRLARDPRLRLAPRLFADVADVAGWSAACVRAHSVPPIVGIPLITETALRHRWRATPLVFVHLLAVGVARRVATRPLRPTDLGHQLVGLLFGVGLRRVERAGADRARASFETQRRAVETSAAIAGHYQVARETYVVGEERVNPHDALSGIRLHFPSARDNPSALHDFTWGGRKGALEALAAEQAVQLDTALRAWRRDTNCRRSALADQVLDPTLPEGHGMSLLSGDQVAELGRALDALDVRGALAVRVTEATRPGARVMLLVNGARVGLPPDPLPTVELRADPTPVAILEGGVMWALLEATDAADAAPLWSVLPGAGAFALLAVWCGRVLRERAEGAHEQVLLLSAVAAVLQAVVVHAGTRGRPDRPDGIQRFPMQTALNAPAMAAGFCWPSLDRRGRRRIVLAFGALGALGLAMLERPRWRVDLIGNTIWLPAVFLPALAYSAGGDRNTQQAQAEIHARHAQAAEHALRRGEQEEWAHIAEACAEALACIDTVDPCARATVEERLRDLLRLAEENLDAC